ncbi:hypothetical protein IHV25_07075 [Phaeovibrio sulfidiphilus]|uniref:Uncharacterized protein n=1 Tax=Phaeovibrio sulfidiphilus TaxID=1220600 RepID=A0A8J6YMG0_9PROT|nr:hypothetical protein [Phaeovibrio sulfidiphilus]MBE1237408.1 hypothetical protein [Phaeovibrio sulfidiphilus]
MVVHFKTKAGPSPVYEITPDNVERVLGRRWPWLQKGRLREEARHFAVCPYCDNPIQNAALYNRNENSPRPYGRHTGSQIDGFPFNLTDLEHCPWTLKNTSPKRSARRKPGPVSENLITMAINEFDRIILILREDFGFSFSKKIAEKMLEQWFDEKAWLYTASHLRNLPWMIAYFAPATTLFGQYVGQNDDLAHAIRTKVPNAELSAEGQLGKGQGWFFLEMQCLDHKIKMLSDETLVESLCLLVRDMTTTDEPVKAPIIYEKRITFDPTRFERLVNTPPDRARRDEDLLQRAAVIAAKKGYKACVAPPDTR